MQISQTLGPTSGSYCEQSWSSNRSWNSTSNPTQKSPIDGRRALCILRPARYHRQFIKGFANILSPLQAVDTGKRKNAYNGLCIWSKRLQLRNIQSAFHNYIVSELWRAVHCRERRFFLRCWSGSPTFVDGRIHAMDFACCAIKTVEQWYRKLEREALAVIFALQKFCMYFRLKSNSCLSDINKPKVFLL